MLAEEVRLHQSERRQSNWHRWGPYLSERQWGTVREDYSANSDSWNYFSHEQSRSRAYRWGEDGLMGLADRQCRLCFSVALWNEKDPILKERLFGLTGPEGNHGEDVKECYYYLDSTPTHSYMKALYKYPQAEYPYQRLLEENRRRGKFDPEYEILDTGVFDDHRYFDVVTEYAKHSPEDILIRITISNRASDAATVHVLPTLWFRNTWSWGVLDEETGRKPWIALQADHSLLADHESLGLYHLFLDNETNPPHESFLFTENETNQSKIFGSVDPGTPSKDAFHEYVIEGKTSAVSSLPHGTKSAAHYRLQIPAKQSVVLKLRLTAERLHAGDRFGTSFDAIFTQRMKEADEFYASRLSAKASPQEHQVARQAFAGLLWSKQFYYFSVRSWLDGDPGQPAPPTTRKNGRNRDWPHLFNRDVISMPDKWEYPWYAAWDLAFHMIPMATIDPAFAKSQLLLMLREWYMHPNGQIPAYEFEFSDVNPPVHAWACWRVYKLTAPKGQRDRVFLARAFQKLLLNFTWWVNRKDVNGKHLFAGGFLGLDNIGLFDRSKPLPGGGYLEQADGTAWMAFFCTTMLAMAIELAEEDPAYEDIASKFFEHFVAITDAINGLGGKGLWDNEDGFYYDQVTGHDENQRLRIRSIVGIIPLFAVEVLDHEVLGKKIGFQRRMEWFLKHRKDLARQISYMESKSEDGTVSPRRMLAIPSRDKLQRVLKYVLDESEFLSPHGVRALSRVHLDRPYVGTVCGQEQRVEYSPAESTTGMFGGNSNWRGPIWFPVNFLLIEALERYHYFYGETFQIECPTGSGQWMTLKQVAGEICRRLSSLFLPGSDGQRPCHGTDRRYADDPQWKDLILFYEYFHGDNGRGMGASHQTGWTALVTRLLGIPPHGARY